MLLICHAIQYKISRNFICISKLPKSVVIIWLSEEPNNLTLLLGQCVFQMNAGEMHVVTFQSNDNYSDIPA